LIECHLDAWREEVEGRGQVRAFAFWGRVYSATAVTVGRQWGMTIHEGRESKREVGMGWDGWGQDTRIALRGLLRRPSFSFIVVLTLGIGLGANVAVYSVLHSVLLAPLPYEESEQLVRVYGSRLDRPGEFDRLALPAPVVLELRDQVSSLSGVAILGTADVRGADLTGGDRPERIRLMPVSADYFEVFGWTPLRGRGFTRAEVGSGARVAVVREAIWERHVGGGAASLGRILMIDGEPVAIVGVVSDAVRDPLEGQVDVWVPTHLGSRVADNWENNYLSAVVRLAPGATLELLRAELAVLESRHRQIPSAAENGFAVVPLREDLVGDSRPLLTAIMGAVMFLLLLTCVNVASLLLARASAREQEIAIRSSLGAPGSRLVRGFMIEAALLAVAGGTAGVLIGTAALDLIMAAAPADLPRREAVLLGQPAILLAGAGSVVIGLMLGLATSLPFAKARVGRVLSATRSNSGSGRPRIRATLVAVEVALAVVLLTGATALIRSVQELRSQPLGVDPSGVLTFTVGLPTVRYGTDDAIHRFNEEFHSQATAVPGVLSAAVTSRLPVTGSYNTWGTRRAHGPETPYDTNNLSVNQRWIAGDIFETIDLDLIAGRWFDPSDGPDTHSRVVVNQELAQRIFADTSPVGEWLTFGGRYSEVIGVVENEALTTRTPAAPMAYHHQRQWLSGNRQMKQLVKVDGSAPDVVPALREALRAVDPELILFEPVLLTDLVGAGMEREAFAASLLAVFAALAVLLAGLGLYGVMIHHVGSQQHEIGVRLALGAETSDIVGMIVRRGMRLTVLGAGVGVVIAFALADTLRSLLFNVDPRDPLLLIVAPVVLCVVAALSCFLPAQRATRLDPLRSLRAE
jgi:putative ABC transport system permease protein